MTTHNLRIRRSTDAVIVEALQVHPQVSETLADVVPFAKKTVYASLKRLRELGRIYVDEQRRWHVTPDPKPVVLTSAQSAVVRIALTGRVRIQTVVHDMGWSVTFATSIVSSLRKLGVLRHEIWGWHKLTDAEYELVESPTPKVRHQSHLPPTGHELFMEVVRRLDTEPKSTLDIALDIGVDQRYIVDQLEALCKTGYGMKSPDGRYRKADPDSW